MTGRRLSAASKTDRVVPPRVATGERAKVASKATSVIKAKAPSGTRILRQK